MFSYQEVGALIVNTSTKIKEYSDYSRIVEGLGR